MELRQLKANAVQKVWQVRYAISALVISGMSFLQTATVYATEKKKESGNEYDFLTDEKQSNGAFDKMTDVVKSTGASGYELVRNLGIVSIGICIMLAGIAYAMSKNAQKKEQNKDWITSIVIGAAITFGALGFVGVLIGIGAGISDS